MRRTEAMAPLNSHQLRALDHLVFESGQLDINALLTNLIDRGELGPYYRSLMGPNSPALRTSKMLEIVNCVKKRGSDAYIALFEAICQTNNAKRCDALHLLAAQLPFNYKPSQNVSQLLVAHMAQQSAHSFGSAAITPNSQSSCNEHSLIADSTLGTVNGFNNNVKVHSQV